MIEIGKVQQLQVLSETLTGYLLEEPDHITIVDIMLPKEQVEKPLAPGDRVTVFVYTDKQGSLLASLTVPPLEVGQIGFLKVTKTIATGAFLDFPGDGLFLPREEQTMTIKEGEKILVGLKLDQQGRLVATMNFSQILSSASPFSDDDLVSGIVYRINPDYGVFVAVDGQYDAMIPLNEVFKNYEVGEEVEARITEVRADGKLNLAVRKKVHFQMGDDASLIYERLKEAGGFLPLHDKSEPEEIYKAFAISKKGFKRAVGKLYKEKKILIKEDGIHLL